MAATFPGQYNTYVPNSDATNNLVADYSRNPDSFALPQYTQYIPVSQNRGYWLEMTVEMAGRLLASDGADLFWADGADAPRQSGNLEAFEFKPYQCKRFAPGFEVGEYAVEQAAWDILGTYGRIAAQRMMTLRTQKVVTLLETTGNYLSTHLINVSSPPADLTLAGDLDSALSTNMDIKKTLDYGYTQIHKSTLGAIKQDDVCLVMNPITAQKLANSQEIREQIKQSVLYPKLIEEQLGSSMNLFGLPPKLYGYKVVVEDAVKVSTQKKVGTAGTKAYVMSDGNIAMVSRPGGLQGVEGAPSFSTIGCMLFREMVVELKHDVDQKRHEGRVIDDFDVQMLSQLSGVLIYNAVS